MSRLEYIAPCHFGLEAVLKRELAGLGMEVTAVDDGRVTFAGNEETAAEANLNLRTAERVLLKAGEFTAKSFDELFEETGKIPWEEILPENARFWVAKAFSVRSALFSPSDIQSVMKKAIVERMKLRYHKNWFDESGPSYPMRVSVKKDVVTIGLDTSGTALHKRGYRVSPVIAPISETLAASLIALTPWHPDRILADPFCGSGTIPIEAAMIAANMAPGLKRSFLAETWSTVIPEEAWKRARRKAETQIIRHPAGTDIQGYDIDARAVRFARDNAAAAGVGELIHFQKRDVRDFHHPKKYGFIITNPPYGERLEEREALPELYRSVGEMYGNLDAWSMYLISSYADTEKYIGKKADKKRKVYNGMLQTYVYQFSGPKPPRRKPGENGGKRQ